MLKKLFIALSFTLLFNVSLRANSLKINPVPIPRQLKINQDTLAKIVKQKDYFIKQKTLIIFIKSYIQASQIGNLDAVQDTLNGFFAKNGLLNREAYLYFMKSVALNRQHNLADAQIYMVKAIQLATKKNEPYLLFQFYSHLGFIQTDLGDFIDAVYNYRLAMKEIAKFKSKLVDNRPQASLNINISDLYYKSGFYSESLNYLDKAWALIYNDEKNMSQLSSAIYYNKSENYFRMRNLDSLKAYHIKLNDPKNKNYKIYNYRQRTAYYITLLQGDYPTAIKQINNLTKSPEYIYSDLEEQHLADAYFMNGQLDSAKKKIDNQLTIASANNHPEIKYHLFALLAQIAQKNGNDKLAALNYMRAFNELQQNNIRLTSVGNISSQIKIDEKETSYIQQTEIFERQRQWLIFIVIIAALIIIAIALIYRNVKQKRHYETLLYAAKREELAFINSHEVRKYLTNILGMVDIMQNSDDKLQDYQEIEPYLVESAAKLDDAIKNISEKLNDE